MHVLLSLAGLAIPALAAPAANNSTAGGNNNSNTSNTLADLVAPIPDCFFLCAGRGLKEENCTSISDVECWCDNFISIAFDINGCIVSQCKDSQEQFDLGAAVGDFCSSYDMVLPGDEEDAAKKELEDRERSANKAKEDKEEDDSAAAMNAPTVLGLGVAALAALLV